MKATTEQIVSALRVLSVDIQSEDGVANAVVAEAAERLTLMANLVARHVEETKDDMQQMARASDTLIKAEAKIQNLRDRIKRLEEALYKIEFYAATGILQDSFDEIKRIAKEAKL